MGKRDLPLSLVDHTPSKLCKYPQLLVSGHLIITFIIPHSQKPYLSPAIIPSLDKFNSGISVTYHCGGYFGTYVGHLLIPFFF